MDGIHNPDENRSIYEITEDSCVFRELRGVVGTAKEWLSSMSRAPVRNYSFLLRAQLGFVVNLFWNDQLLAGVLGKRDRRILRVIGNECMAASREVMELCGLDDVVKGFGAIKSEIGRCVVDAGGGKDESLSRV